MKRFSTTSHVIIAAVIVTAALSFWHIRTRYQTPKVEPIKQVSIDPKPTDKTPDKQPSTTLPNTVSLKVPFTSQAPTGNWDELHGEACEEASAIMAHAYFSGKTETKLDAAYVEDEIAKITQWEKDTYGYYLDIDSRETARLIEDVYNLKTRIIQNYTEADIKKELTDGNLVILSFNGKLLGNPNFRNGGPVYHMLVARGYNKEGLVTNDPGTRNGMNYFYTWETVTNAAAEWQHDTRKTDSDIKLAIVVSK